MRRSLGFALICALCAQVTGVAQTSTADAIQALVSGDYATAERLLTAEAERRNPDPLALFFQAGLITSQLGPSRSPIRACGLYLQSATKRNPFAAQAKAMARAVHQDAPAFVELCAAASRGPWREPPGATFALDTAYSIRFDDAGIVILRDGTESRPLTFMGGFAVEWLPLRYTALDVPRPVPHRRHFVESLYWKRRAGARGWELRWSALEVVGTTVPVGASAIVATTHWRKPAKSDGFSGRARLFVNDNGEVEWTAGRERGVIAERSLP